MISLRHSAVALALIAGTACPALAQDSVATTAGGNDALAATDTSVQRVRYVVDLTQVGSSWSNPYLIAPIHKTSRDVNPLFSNQIPVSTAVSPTSGPLSLGSPTAYAFWNTAGPGVNPNQNGPAGSVNASSFDRAFGAAVGDLSGTSTNAVALRVGQNASDVSRLFVERTVMAISRFGVDDTASISVGGATQAGDAFLRLDGFNTSGVPVQGENAVFVDNSARNTLAPSNFLNAGGATNSAVDGGAVTFLFNNAEPTLNTPAALLGTGGSALGAIFDFAGGFSVDGAAPTTNHIDPAIDAIRGNPAFAAVPFNGSAGTLAALAKPAGSADVTAINIAGLNASGGVVSTGSVALPSPINSASTAFSANATGDASFEQYLSQVSFRGPNGLVGIGSTQAGDVVVAATATDPIEGSFIAVATLGASTTWDVAAHAGMPVLSGPGGDQIGTLTASAPISLSAPAVDRFGNVYFVGTFQPGTASPAVGFFKAVRGAGGYELELIIRTGASLTGQNSATNYVITDIALADSDGLASGAFHGSQIIQQLIPGLSPASPAEPETLGGALLNATIEYNRAGTPETYNATLYVAPSGGPVIPACSGDVDGDGGTGTSDLLVLLSNWGSSGPSIEPSDGDLSGDNSIGTADLLVLLADWGCTSN